MNDKAEKKEDKIVAVVAPKFVVFAKLSEAERLLRVAGRVRYFSTLSEYGYATSWWGILPPFVERPAIDKPKIMDVVDLMLFALKHVKGSGKKVSEEVINEMLEKIDLYARLAKRVEPRKRERARPIIFRGSLKSYMKTIRTAPHGLAAETKNYYIYRCSGPFWLFVRKMSDDEIVESVEKLKTYLEDMEDAKEMAGLYKDYLRGFEDVVEYLDKVMSMVKILG